MKLLKPFKISNQISVFLVALLTLSACSSDKPFVATPRGGSSSTGTGSGSGGTGGGTGGGLPEGTCQIFFQNVTLQMQISAPPPDGAVIIDDPNDPVGFYPVPNIPMIFEENGTKVTMKGKDFPRFAPYLGNPPPAYLEIYADSTKDSTGHFDPNTGALIFDGSPLKLLADVALSKGDAFFGTMTNLPAVKLTTEKGQVGHGKGNPKEIVVDGENFNPNDNSIVLVAVMDVPAETGVPAADSAMGNGALAAIFKGTLSQDPVECTPGGGTGGGTTGGGTGGEDSVIQVRDVTAGELLQEGQDHIFGNAESAVRIENNLPKLDCSDPANRGIISRAIEISNPGDKPLQILGIIGGDSDGDNNVDGGCETNKSEFDITGLTDGVSPSGGVDCDFFMVGPFKYYKTPCTLQPSSLDPDAKISFIINYVPKNYFPPEQGQDIEPQDRGFLTIPYNNGEGAFSVPLVATTIKSAQDDFYLTKKDSTFKIVRGGQIKFIQPDPMNKVVALDMVLNNKGYDNWTVSEASMESGKNIFQVIDLVGKQIAAGNGQDNPQQLPFQMKFSPDGPDTNGVTYNDVLTIKLSKGQVESVLKFNLVGTVGIKSPSGQMNLQITYAAAVLSNIFVDDALTSGELRYTPDKYTYEFSEFPPKPIPLKFDAMQDANGFQEVTFPIVDDKSILDYQINVPKDRLNRLNVFTSRMTRDKDGNSGTATDTSKICSEPTDQEFHGPYIIDKDKNPNSFGKCSRFFFNIIPDNNFVGKYNDDTGDLYLTNIARLRMENPFHADVASYGASNPLGADEESRRLIDVDLKISLVTTLIDKKEVKYGPNPNDKFNLVPAGVSDSELSLNAKYDTITRECPSDVFDVIPVNQNTPNANALIDDKYPSMKCFIKDEKYLQGRAMKSRTDNKYKKTSYDVVLVGVTRFPPDGTPDALGTPFFMRNNGGSIMWVVIQGVLSPP